jgi:hypothetical protein
MVAVPFYDYKLKIKRPTATEKLYRANVVVSHGMDGLEIIKCRYYEPIKNPSLPYVIDLLVTSYLNSDLTKDLTPSAMMNVPIKEDLRKAFNDVLIKHGLERSKYGNEKTSSHL